MTLKDVDKTATATAPYKVYIHDIKADIIKTCRELKKEYAIAMMGVGTTEKINLLNCKYLNPIKALMKWAGITEAELNG